MISRITQPRAQLKTGPNIARPPMRRDRNINRQRGIVRKTTVYQGPKLNIVPLGGLDGIGKNMAFLEYGNDIIIIDIGIMFAYEDMPGVDFIIPDTSYLQKNYEKIRGVVITHGHLDHMGGIPYILKRLGNPPIFGTKLTLALTRDRLEEFQLDRIAKLNVIHPDDQLKLGVFGVSFFRVNHNIPDSVGVVVKTPVGNIVHTGDFKFDYTPINEAPAEFGKIAKIGNEGVLLAMSDSTNAEQKGFTVSEREIGVQLDQLIGQAKGRVVVSTFANLLARVQQVIDASVKHGRKVAFSGRSMEKAVMIATKYGYLKYSASAIVKLTQVSQFPPNRVTILSTGSQGQEESALGRMARGEHKQIQIRSGDTVILSSSPIPGNERAIARIMNNLVDLGADVIYNKTFDVHASGHAKQEELKLMLMLLRPKFFVPVHGERFMLKVHGELAESIGIPRANIFILNNGDILEVGKDRAQITGVKIPAGLVLVDGLGVGDVGQVVLRDRQVMAQDGMVVIIATIDKKTEQLVSELDIISRGFVYVNASEKLIFDLKERVKRTVESAREEEKESGWAPLRNRMRDEIGDFLYQQTERRPMILPVIIRI
ncbi:MAG TPA: ribonuclease J [Patescibacteria group bacterium]|nr:ribonuclease J [Patescibacteria group bacterium]